MSKQEDENSFDYKLMEAWLENYFLDPLTTYEDQMQFRIDLYETDQEWIVEALLDDFEAYEITVAVQSKELSIKAAKHPLLPSSIHPKRIMRCIQFPFAIVNHKITAFFQNGILEVHLSKKETDRVGRNRFITLP